MIRCHYCGTDNLDGSEFCDECGNRLGVSLTAHRSGAIHPPVQPAAAARTPGPAPAQAPRNLPPPPPSFVNENINPRPATPYTQPADAGQASRPPGIPSSGRAGGPAEKSHPRRSEPLAGAVESPRVRIVIPDSGAATGPQVRARLVIQRGGKIGKEFLLYESEALIGRWDADGGIFPDIDLDQDDPEAKISRRHARLIQVNNQFLIEDLGSTNGTFINRGPRLLAGIRQPLNHGDEIIVGKTFLKFFLG